MKINRSARGPKPSFLRSHCACAQNLTVYQEIAHTHHAEMEWPYTISAYIGTRSPVVCQILGFHQILKQLDALFEPGFRCAYRRDDFLKDRKC